MVIMMFARAALGATRVAKDVSQTHARRTKTPNARRPWGKNGMRAVPQLLQTEDVRTALSANINHGLKHRISLDVHGMRVAGDTTHCVGWLKM